jgi:hemolysin activation/secretion protein
VPAQTHRPADDRLDVKLPEAARTSALRLPPIPPLRRDRVAPSGTIQVNEVSVAGSTVFTVEDLRPVVAPSLARPLHAEDLVELRDAVSRLYIERGYLNSGAVILEQNVQDGVLEIQAVEGTLEKVEVAGAEQFRPSWFTEQLVRPDDGPLNVRELEQKLQVMRGDPRIKRLEARLVPGERRGLSRLELDIEETSRFGLGFYGSNDRSSTIGSESGRVDFAYRNLAGIGDELQFGFGLTEGLDEYRVGYTLPLYDTSTILDFDFRDSYSDIVNSAFEEIGIESESRTVGVGIEHALLRTPTNELVLGLRGERRRSVTRIDGTKLSFALGAEDGESRVSVLRTSQSWTSRSQTDVFALRSTLSFGLDVLDASDSDGRRNELQRERDPDGTFVAWLLQAQWAHRLPERYWGSQLLWRMDAQVSPRSLLSLEQFSLGGTRTVRGYRENELVRDNGIATSIELRVPILRTALGRDVLQLAPFFDFGHGWNDGTKPRNQKSISSVGAGLRYQAMDGVFMSVYYGSELRNYKRTDNDLQNHGLHFTVSVAAF